MKIVEQIKQPIAYEMELFEQKFLLSMSSKVALLNRITHYIVNRKGKQMRPMFVFLVAKMVDNGQVSERTYRGASVIELIHTATLVHDDVVDDSNRRRGFFSINALWKNKIAVLIGDYLLSKGLLLSIDNNDFDLLKIISVAVREMSEGELLQIEKARQLDITETVYYEIIRQKTATLIAACCSLGAASVRPNSPDVETMRKFGELIGMAFQIKDDLFDILGATKDTGKDANADVSKNMITLPIIHTMSSSLSTVERRQLRKTLSNGAKRRDVKRLKEIVFEHGGFDYAKKKLQEFSDEAVSALSPFPDSAYKRSMIDLCLYNVQRTR